MADNNFPGLSQPRDAYNAIVHKMDEARGDANIEVIPGGELTPELRAIGEQEIEMALADFDCRVATNFRQRQETRWFDAETQFVSDHREAVNAFKDALAQRGQGT